MGVSAAKHMQSLRLRKFFFPVENYMLQHFVAAQQMQHVQQSDTKLIINNLALTKFCQ